MSVENIENVKAEPEKEDTTASIGKIVSEIWHEKTSSGTDCWPGWGKITGICLPPPNEVLLMSSTKDLKDESINPEPREEDPKQERKVNRGPMCGRKEPLPTM